MLKGLLILCCVFSSKATDNTSLINKTYKNDSLKNNLVVYVFEGSDWCTNCYRFKKKVLGDSVFTKALDSIGAQIEILDFPQRKKLSRETMEYNRIMSEKFGFTGKFPSIVLFSSHSGKFTTMWYKREDANEFVDILFNQLDKLNE
jgi:hypothetical protein